ncbi:MAG TPA: hypothetical protein VJA66_01610 [Thermoanaerobaculia bacterium]
MNSRRRVMDRVDPPVTGAGAACVALLVLGAALRLWQFGVGASQWLDELALSRAIVGLSFSALWGGHLPFLQVAPKGFLLLQKAAVSLWGTSDYVLRLLPLVSSLAALLLFYVLARRIFVRSAAIVFALTLFALQPELIRYASQVKPYSTDLAVALALTLLTCSLAEGDSAPGPIRGVFVGLAGAVAVTFSHAAALVLAGLSAALALSVVLSGRRRGFAGLAAIIGLWVSSSGAAAFIAARHTTAQGRDYLLAYWRASFGPTRHNIANDTAWLIKALVQEVAALRYPWPVFYLALAFLGAVSLWRRSRSLSLALFLPVVAALFAAELHVYPFSHRLVLFGVPAFVLAIAAGVEALTSLVRRNPDNRFASIRIDASIFLAALLPAILTLQASLPPYLNEEMKPILRDMAARRLPGDSIYVFYGAGQAVSFYGARYGFRPQDYVLGGCHQEDTRAYLREIDGFRGLPRVWVLISHDWRGERLALLDYLDHLGTRTLAIRAPAHGPHALVSEAYLYDLSAARPSPGVDSMTFPIPRAAPNWLDSRFPCRGAENPVPEIPLEPPG